MVSTNKLKNREQRAEEGPLPPSSQTEGRGFALFIIDGSLGLGAAYFYAPFNVKNECLSTDIILFLSTILEIRPPESQPSSNLLF